MIRVNKIEIKKIIFYEELYKSSIDNFNELRNHLKSYLHKRRARSWHYYTQHIDNQCKDTQHNNTQHNDTQCKDTQHNDTQHNDTQHNDTQYNDTQHNDTQHKDTHIMILNTLI